MTDPFFHAPGGCGQNVAAPFEETREAELGPDRACKACKACKDCWVLVGSAYSRPERLWYRHREPAEDRRRADYDEVEELEGVKR